MIGASLGFGVVLAYLLDRIKALEKRIESASADSARTIGEVAIAIIQPDPADAKLIREQGPDLAITWLERFGSNAATHTPALRRVLHLEISLNLEYLSERFGIERQDLIGLEDQLAPICLCPACLMIVEQWTTHTVVTDYKGQRRVIYKGIPKYGNPDVIWEHTIPSGDQKWDLETLELVIHEGSITCWAVDGRFGRSIPPVRVAKEEHIFVSIPMDDKSLEKYLVCDEEQAELQSRSSIRRYQCGDSEEKFWWSLVVNDVASYVRS